MSRKAITAVFVGGPKAGWVMAVEAVRGDQPPDVIAVQGIDFVDGVPLPEQTVVTETGNYVRTYFERSIDGIPGWRYEWRGWSGSPSRDAADRIGRA